MAKTKAFTVNLCYFLAMYAAWSLWQIFGVPRFFPGAGWIRYCNILMKGIFWVVPMFLFWKREGWLVQPSEAFRTPYPWFPCLVMLCTTVCFLFTVRIAVGRQNAVVVWENTFLLFSLSAGVIEEISFRGFLFNRLAPAIGVFPAAMMNGFMFAVFHYPGLLIGRGLEQIVSQRGLMLLCVGTIFSLVFAKWKNLWLLIIVHSFWNVLTYLFALTG